MASDRLWVSCVALVVNMLVGAVNVKGPLEWLGDRDFYEVGHNLSTSNGHFYVRK
jgi:hypothetical protein